MRTFGKKPKATQQTPSARSPKYSRSFVGRNHRVQFPLQLQRTIGNQAVLRFLHEDNNMDNQINTALKTPHNGPILSEEGAIQKTVPNTGAGKPLSPDARAAIETHFGYDFSRVRVHTNSHIADALSAKAFTNAQNIFFSPRRSPSDLALLAHEAAHVVQQATGEANALQGAKGDESVRKVLEDRAERQSMLIDHGTCEPLRALPLKSFTPAVVQFDFEEDVLSELHRLPSPAQEGLAEAEQRRRMDVISGRRARLYELFNSLSIEEARRYHERLRARRRGDTLSERFHDILATATRRELLRILEPPALSGAETLAHEREAEGEEAPTFHQTHSLEDYVDLFERVIYDLFHPPGPDNSNSTTLHVYYRDGAYITIDLYDISESQSDLATELGHLYEGEGNRVFPVVMNRTTVPNLWRAKHEALRTMDDYNVSFVMGTVPVVLMFVSMAIGAGGGGQLSSRRIPRARARRVYQWPPRVPGFRGSAARIQPVNGHVEVGGGATGGIGNAAGRTNLQPFVPGTGGPPASASTRIPNLVQGNAGEIGSLFQPGSIRLLSSSRLPAGTVRWEQFALGAREAMAPGGRVYLNVWCRTQEQVQRIISAFRRAGFQNVRAGVPGIPGSSGGAGTIIQAVR